jgi:hypothetical protein
MTAFPSRREYLRRLLNLYWLRPESALWYAHEAAAARAYLGDPVPSPSLELACFDGAPTFVMLGGVFGPEFDVYSEVTWSADSIHWKSLKDDYYNVSSQSGAPMPVLERPQATFDFGLTEKQAHADKAARLGLHRRVLTHDPSAPLTMFEPGQLATIWAPNFYWVKDIGAALAEVRRVLRPDGRFVTVLPDVSVLQHLLYRLKDRADAAWIKDLDRGRHDNFARHARDLAGWTDLFAHAGLRVARHDDLIPLPVLKAWDVGLRPMFPVLMHVYEALKARAPDEWLKIKLQWIETADHFLGPLCDLDWMKHLQSEMVWHIFALQPTQ